MTDPIEHPGAEHLAGFVDGALSASERAAVARHLDMCARCTAEVAEASAARAVLVRLETVEVPPGIAAHALAATTEEAPQRRAPSSGTPRWYRWAGAAAVAAGFALVLFLVLPKFGGHDASTTGIGATMQRGPVMIEISAQDFQPASVRQLASSFAAGKTQGSSAAATSGGVAPSGPETNVAPSAGPHPKVVTARACVKKAFRQVNGTLERLIQARFKGEPAYLAIYTQGSVPGQPDDAVTVRVAAIDGCRALTIAGAPLPSPAP
jgi:anti-sigma factor RsiW